MQNLTLEKFIKQFAMIRKAYAKLCHASLASYNFSPSEIDILIFLSNNPSLNTAKQVKIFLNISKSLVCRSVDSLIERGLLQEKMDRHDRRIQRLSLSDKSQDIIAILKQSQLYFSEAISKNIDEKDLQITHNVLEKIHINIENLDKGGHIE